MVSTTTRSTKPLISVVIPCYKQADFLDEAIRSVLTQTYQSYEIIVVDDGSPDHTAQVVRRHPAVRYIRQSNQGVSAARNKGLHESKGEYIVFLDADDRLLPNHLWTGLTAFSQNPKAALVCGSFVSFGDHSSCSTHQFDPTDHYASVLRFPSIAMVQTAMFKRDIFKEVGGFDERLRTAEDFELYLRITKRHPIHFHQELVAEYRVHSNQATKDWRSMLKGIMLVYRSQRNYITQNPQYRDVHTMSLNKQQLYWGEPVVHDMAAAARSGDLKRFIPAFWTLVRFYPESLKKLARRKFSTVCLQAKSFLLHYTR